MLEHNPNLDRWGNAMEFINGVAAGAVNPFLSAGEAVGVEDALYGTGYAIDKATMYGIAPLSADGKWSAIEKLDRLAGVEKDIGNAVRDWSAENPNAAETVEAAFNAAAVAKAAKLAKTGAGKAAVSDNFADSIKIEATSSNVKRPNWRDSESDVGKSYPNYDYQKSFKGGNEVPYGTKGSVRPEYYTRGHSVEVKNYNIETSSGRNNLINNVSKQVKQRTTNLPEGTKQTVVIDIRGQNVSNDTLKNVRNRIIEKSKSNVDIMFKR